MGLLASRTKAAGGGGGDPPALVGLKTKAQTGSQVTSTNVNISSVAAGNLIVVVFAVSAAGVSLEADSATLNFVEDAYNGSGGAADVSIAVWSAPNAGAGSHTITLNIGALEFVRYAVIEFTNVATSDHVIDANTGVGLTQNATVGSVTTGLNNTLLFGGIRTDGDETAHGDISEGSGFTLVYAFAAEEPEQKLMAEYDVVNAGTYPPSTLFNMEFTDGGGWRTILVAYKGE